MPGLSAFGLSDRGKIRKRNEDRWFSDPEQGLHIVADGMGGAAQGETAAKIVVKVLPMMLRQALAGLDDAGEPAMMEALGATISNFNRIVVKEAGKHPGLSGMGSTFVMILDRGEKAFIVHLGDSRAYLMREGNLRPLTRDHTIVQILLDNGEISEEQARVHPSRNHLTRFVGMPGEALPEILALTILSGDRILLCTDGLTKMVPDSLTEKLLRGSRTPEEACMKLVDAANSAGGEDNVTVVVIDS